MSQNPIPKKNSLIIISVRPLNPSPDQSPITTYLVEIPPGCRLGWIKLIPRPTYMCVRFEFERINHAP